MTDTFFKDSLTNSFNGSSLWRSAPRILSGIFRYSDHKGITDKQKELYAQYRNSVLEAELEHGTNVSLAKETALLAMARKIARDEFEPKFRRNGESKFLHTYRVATEFSHDIILKQIAYLHDIVEDTNWTLSDLHNLGFSKRVIDAVDALTKRKNEPYLNYLMRLVKNADARMVKMVDIMDNSQSAGVSRLRETFLYPVATAYINFVDNHPNGSIPDIRAFIRNHAKQIAPQIEIATLKQHVNDNSRRPFFDLAIHSLKFAS